MTEYLDIGSDHQFLVPTSPWMPSAISSSSSSVGGSVVVDNSWTLDDSAIPSLRFPQKLWRIVNECNSGAITWGLSGQTVRLNYKSFQNEYLSAGASIFKTSNIASFIRQLNLYGFRKLATNTRDPFGPIPTAQEQDIHEFVHEHFREGRLDLLSRVCRKTGVKKTERLPSRRKGELRKRNELETVHYVEKRSRLQMCRAALTEALEEATLLYKREKLWLQLVNANILSESFLPKYETLTVDQNVEVVFQDDLSVLGDNCQIIEDSSSNSIVDNDEKNQWQEVLSLENGGTISISTPFL
ncbi:heat shock transcription factor, X-linked member 4-like [Copidosoma floridanum]|uniref:heat shock transcription factor, X-linked member 4-like n=1 Tax=Copidosoma floridanum TaxID=29053 RepID=UPI000C6FA084|nr:heat shock transcription factor, X-linked member 4-like [Copidosoma floridanum]